MKRFAVVGHPIAHSRSPDIHRAFAQQCNITLQYERCELPIDIPVSAFKAFLAQQVTQGCYGINVTAPFKAIARQCVDACSIHAQEAGVINTLTHHNGVWQGHNTDGLGWCADLQRLQWSLRDKTILILGAGGGVAGILGPLLAQAPAHVMVAARNISAAHALISPFSKAYNVPLSVWDSTVKSSCDIMINALPRGVLPTDLQVFETLSQISKGYDLNYDTDNPTPFLQQLNHCGVHAGVDGWGMLLAQAAYSFELWHGVFPNWQEFL